MIKRVQRDAAPDNVIIANVLSLLVKSQSSQLRTLLEPITLTV
jgi:hypothetical protein